MSTISRKNPYASKHVPSTPKDKLFIWPLHEPHSNAFIQTVKDFLLTTNTHLSSIDDVNALKPSILFHSQQFRALYESMLTEHTINIDRYNAHYGALSTSTDAAKLTPTSHTSSTHYKDYIPREYRQLYDYKITPSNYYQYVSHLQTLKHLYQLFEIVHLDPSANITIQLLDWYHRMTPINSYFYTLMSNAKTITANNNLTINTPNPIKIGLSPVLPFEYEINSTKYWELCEELLCQGRVVEVIQLLQINQHIISTTAPLDGYTTIFTLLLYCILCCPSLNNIITQSLIFQYGINDKCCMLGCFGMCEDPKHGSDDLPKVKKIKNKKNIKTDHDNLNTLPLDATTNNNVMAKTRDNGELCDVFQKYHEYIENIIQKCNDNSNKTLHTQPYYNLFRILRGDVEFIQYKYLNNIINYSQGLQQHVIDCYSNKNLHQHKASTSQIETIVTEFNSKHGVNISKLEWLSLCMGIILFVEPYCDRNRVSYIIFQSLDVCCTAFDNNLLFSNNNKKGIANNNSDDKNDYIGEQYPILQQITLLLNNEYKIDIFNDTVKTIVSNHNILYILMIFEHIINQQSYETLELYFNKTTENIALFGCDWLLVIIIELVFHSQKVDLVAIHNGDDGGILNQNETKALTKLQKQRQKQYNEHFTQYPYLLPFHPPHTQYPATTILNNMIKNVKKAATQTSTIKSLIVQDNEGNSSSQHSDEDDTIIMMMSTGFLYNTGLPIDLRTRYFMRFFDNYCLDMISVVDGHLCDDYMLRILHSELTHYIKFIDKHQDYVYHQFSIKNDNDAKQSNAIKYSESDYTAMLCDYNLIDYVKNYNITFHNYQKKTIKIDERRNIVLSNLSLYKMLYNPFYQQLLPSNTNANSAIVDMTIQFFNNHVDNNNKIADLSSLQPYQYHILLHFMTYCNTNKYNPSLLNCSGDLMDHTYLIEMYRKIIVNDNTINLFTNSVLFYNKYALLQQIISLLYKEYYSYTLKFCPHTNNGDDNLKFALLSNPYIVDTVNGVIKTFNHYIALYRMPIGLLSLLSPPGILSDPIVSNITGIVDFALHFDEKVTSNSKSSHHYYLTQFLANIYIFNNTNIIHDVTHHLISVVYNDKILSTNNQEDLSVYYHIIINTFLTQHSVISSSPLGLLCPQFTASDTHDEWHCSLSHNNIVVNSLVNKDCVNSTHSTHSYYRLIHFFMQYWAIENDLQSYTNIVRDLEKLVQHFTNNINTNDDVVNTIKSLMFMMNNNTFSSELSTTFQPVSSFINEFYTFIQNPIIKHTHSKLDVQYFKYKLVHMTNHLKHQFLYPITETKAPSHFASLLHKLQMVCYNLLTLSQSHIDLDNITYTNAVIPHSFTPSASALQWLSLIIYHFFGLYNVLLNSFISFYNNITEFSSANTISLTQLLIIIAKSQTSSLTSLGKNDNHIIYQHLHNIIGTYYHKLNNNIINHNNNDVTSLSWYFYQIPRRIQKLFVIRSENTLSRPTNFLYAYNIIPASIIPNHFMPCHLEKDCELISNDIYRVGVVNMENGQNIDDTLSYLISFHPLYNTVEQNKKFSEISFLSHFILLFQRHILDQIKYLTNQHKQHNHLYDTYNSPPSLTKEQFIEKYNTKRSKKLSSYDEKIRHTGRSNSTIPLGTLQSSKKHLLSQSKDALLNQHDPNILPVKVKSEKTRNKSIDLY